MASSMRSLLSDGQQYAETFHEFLNHSTEHQCMLEFIEKKLPAIVQRFANRKSTIEILGVGSGTGEIDLQMISQIQTHLPGVLLNYDVIEPTQEHILKFKDLVAKTSDLKNINFTWHMKTSSEYEKDMNETQESKTFDFIHLIQMMYYVKDASSTLKFFKSLLASNGILLILIISGSSGWASLWKTYGHRLPLNDLCVYITSSDIKNMLDEAEYKYTYYELPSEMDITECFVEGSKTGTLLLDFLTETYNFEKTAPPDLKAEIMDTLKQPECSIIRDGKIIFNNTLTALLVEP
uniref:Histamine N-methyltransferase isoform X2 n=1 Tax=Geotrypetes seraphini TaxID=260995 RepID=A0A6P8RFH4_GEOSA|nr:histamine N-methyltransferase isoform X2 [Geotrypetes seraphini]XP_033802398.1 histamine N-methyltransferase isoform X2 [Geotrypetes seraphini]